MTDYAAPLVTAAYEGRFGRYDLAVFGPAPGPRTADGAPDPTVLSLGDEPRCAFGEVAPAFGGGPLPWSVDVRATDPGGVLDGLFGDDFDPAAYAVRTTGPDGRGGTWTVWTRPMRGELQGTASPLVRASADAGLGTHDGLATLADVPAEAAAGVDLQALWGRLLHQAMPGRADDATGGGPQGRWDVDVAWPLTSAAEEAAGDVRLGGEPTGDPDDESPDLGQVEDQLVALARAASLSVYQPSDAPPDAPRWEVRPRSRVGADRPAVELPPYTADASGDAAGRVRRAGTVTLEGRAQVVYPTPSAALGTGEEEPVRVGEFAATPGLRFRFDETRREYLDRGDPHTLGEYRLELAGTDGQTYYGPDWGTSARTMSPGATTADLPVGGVVSLVLVGEDELLDTDDDDATPDSREFARFFAGTVRLEDAAGDAVTDLAVRLGSPGGDPVALPLLPVLQVWTGTAWVGLSAVRSAVTGRSHATLAEAEAATRLAMQGANLRRMTVEVSGLWGPECRFTLAGRDGGNLRSPWREDVELVATGGEVSLRRGTTLLSLVSALEVPA